MRALGFVTAGAIVAAAAAAGVAFVIGLPDMRRYIKMKRM